MEGGCFCGKIRFRVEGAPFNATLCYCVDCRKVAATPVVAWFSAKRDKVHFEGEPLRSFLSSAGVTRSFCGGCGTMLTYTSTAFPDEIDIATGSLDDPAQAPPRDHVWVSQKLAWTTIADDLPQFPRGRGDNAASS